MISARESSANKPASNRCKCLRMCVWVSEILRCWVIVNKVGSHDVFDVDFSKATATSLKNLVNTQHTVQEFFVIVFTKVTIIALLTKRRTIVWYIFWKSAIRLFWLAARHALPPPAARCSWWGTPTHTCPAQSLTNHRNVQSMPKDPQKRRSSSFQTGKNSNFDGVILRSSKTRAPER